MNSDRVSFEYDTVFYEAFEEEERALKSFLPSDKKYLFTWKSIQESGHATPPAPIISTRTQSEFPPEWSQTIEAIVTRSTGYDHVTAYRKTCKKEIPSAYLPDYAGRDVAEQAMLMWTALLRNFNTQQQHFNTFLRSGITGKEVMAKTILVIGVGRIGSQIADIACGLKMNVLGVDLKQNAEYEKKYNMHYLALEDGLCQADIAVCALPLTEITHGWLNLSKLNLMPKGGIFINIARGEISPAEDLLTLLENKQLSGIGLDVYDREKELASILREGSSLAKLPQESRTSVDAILKLIKNPHAVLTPHNAFNTEESVSRKSRHTAENLCEYFKTGKFLTAVPSSSI